MCNFVVRPIKSYATVDVIVSKTIKRGDVVTVKDVSEKGVGVYIGEVSVGAVIHIPFEVFTHAFTANPKDVEKVKKEEEEFFKK
jgi:hypothetical protein